MIAYNCPIGRALCDGCNNLLTSGCLLKQNQSQQLITHDDMVAIYDRKKEQLMNLSKEDLIELIIDTLEVKESKLPNPRFPHLDNIVEKVFGAGNLESWEYEEAKQLVLLAKKELLKDLEVKEMDLEKEMESWRHNHFHGRRDNKGANGEYLERVSQLDLAKHFFELGLKAQKGE